MTTTAASEALTALIVNHATDILITSALMLEAVPFMVRSAEECVTLAAVTDELERRHPDAAMAMAAWLASDPADGSYTVKLCELVSA